MKKTLLFVLLILLTFCGVSEAKILHHINNFDGAKWISSSYSKGGGMFGLTERYEIELNKCENGEFYIEVTSMTEGGQGNVLFDKVAKIKIDGEIYQMNLIECWWDGKAEMGKVGAAYELSYPDAVRISKAKEIAFLCYWGNGSGYKAPIYFDKLPDKVIKEWGELFNTNV